MADPFIRMHTRLFARLGDEAFLRTTESCRASVVHGVEMTDEYGSVAGYRTVIDIWYLGLIRPKAGDALVVTAGTDAGTYKLDAALQDDGYTARWVVL